MRAPLSPSLNIEMGARRGGPTTKMKQHKRAPSANIKAGGEGVAADLRNRKCGYSGARFLPSTVRRFFILHFLHHLHLYVFELLGARLFPHRPRGGYQNKMSSIVLFCVCAIAFLSACEELKPLLDRTLLVGCASLFPAMAPALSKERVWKFYTHVRLSI